MKQYIHEKISRHALYLFNSSSTSKTPDNISSAFISGSINEDEISLTRFMNWHFYNNGGIIGRYRKYGILCNGSNEKIFQKRLNELNTLLSSNADKLKIYGIAGRMAHHIQDMSSPPHVIPVYHLGSDKFDSYINDTYVLPDIKPVAYPIDCTPDKLLDQAARNTLNSIKDDVIFTNGGTIPGESWLKFWHGDDDKNLNGFKKYGEYGNTFGINRECKGVAQYSYDESLFNRFFNECYTRAVTDTVNLLVYLDKRINSAGKDQKSSH